MITPKPDLELTRLGPDDRDAAVTLLAAAFHDYPVMRHVLGEPLAAAPRSTDYRMRLDALVGFFCDKRLSRGWPVFALRSGAAISSVALVTPPEGGSLGAATERARLLDQVGEEALSRLDRYEEVTDLDAPDAPHHTLGVLGTDPSRQGSGDGGRVLQEVVRVAARHPTSTGVCLNTEVERNVGFYARHGFRVVGEQQIADLHSWCLFRSVA